MKRLATSTLLLLMLWALVPGVGEAVENGLHLVLEGHMAHAAPEGDSHTPWEDEHGCTGAMHFCSCCVSQTFIAVQVVAQLPEQSYQRLTEQDWTKVPASVNQGIYHPPRA
jgi:hypothetical protein